jgi:prophage maintenance system killer protein
MNTNEPIFKEYIKSFQKRMIYGLLDPNNHQNHDKIKDYMWECDSLFRRKTNLGEILIERINIGITISETCRWGYREHEVENIELGIPSTPAKDIRNKIHTLLNNYKKDWKDLDPYLREAKFHIDFIRIHPFYDGNIRTAVLLLNSNLVKQHLYPVVIDTSDSLEYQRCINTYDYECFANLLRSLSNKEEKIYLQLKEKYV